MALSKDNTSAENKQQAIKEAHEKLLTSLEQLSQVIEILGKLTQRIRQQAQALPGQQKSDNMIHSYQKEEDTIIH